MWLEEQKSILTLENQLFGPPPVTRLSFIPVMLASLC